MYRLNANITEEAEKILKDEARRLGASMGTIVTMWALDKKKENDALAAIALYKQEQENGRAAR